MIWQCCKHGCFFLIRSFCQSSINADQAMIGQSQSVCWLIGAPLVLVSFLNMSNLNHKYSQLMYFPRNLDWVCLKSYLRHLRPCDRIQLMTYNALYTRENWYQKVYLALVALNIFNTKYFSAFTKVITWLVNFYFYWSDIWPLIYVLWPPLVPGNDIKFGLQVNVMTNNLKEFDND